MKSLRCHSTVLLPRYSDTRSPHSIATIDQDWCAIESRLSGFPAVLTFEAAASYGLTRTNANHSRFQSYSAPFILFLSIPPNFPDHTFASALRQFTAFHIDLCCIRQFTSMAFLKRSLITISHPFVQLQPRKSYSSHIPDPVYLLTIYTYILISRHITGQLLTVPKAAVRP